MPDAPRKAMLLMALAALALSAMTALAKFATASLPSAEVVFFRSLIAALLLLGIHAASGRKAGPLTGHRANRPWLVLRGLLGGSALLLFFYGLSGLATADAMLLNKVSPVWILLLGAPLLGERIRPIQLLVAPVALVGAALVIRPDLGFVNWFGLAALGSSLLAAGAHLCVRKVTRSEQGHVVVLYFAVTATVFSAPLMLPAFTWPGPWTWLALVGVGALSVVFQLLLTAAYRYDTAGRVAMAGYLGPVFAGVWDAVFWHHLPDWVTLAGAALILGSLVVLASNRRAIEAA